MGARKNQPEQTQAAILDLFQDPPRLEATPVDRFLELLTPL